MLHTRWIVCLFVHLLCFLCIYMYGPISVYTIIINVIVSVLSGRCRDDSETSNTTGSLPSPYDNVQTPPRDVATGRGHHIGMLPVTIHVVTYPLFNHRSFAPSFAAVQQKHRVQNTQKYAIGAGDIFANENEYKNENHLQNENYTAILAVVAVVVLEFTAHNFTSNWRPICEYRSQSQSHHYNELDGLSTVLTLLVLLTVTVIIMEYCVSLYFF